MRRRLVMLVILKEQKCVQRPNLAQLISSSVKGPQINSVDLPIL